MKCRSHIDPCYGIALLHEILTPSTHAHVDSSLKSDKAMAHRAFARLQTLQNQLAPFDASVLEGYLEPLFRDDNQETTRRHY